MRPCPNPQDEWNDKMTGEKRSAVKVVANQVGVLPRRSNQQQQPAYANSAAAPAGAAPYYDQQPAAPQQQQGYQQQWEPAQQPQQHVLSAQQQWGEQPAAGAAAAPWDQQPAPPQQQQQQQPAAPAFYSDSLPLPPVPANEIEERWLSVINNPQDWWDNRIVSGGASSFGEAGRTEELPLSSCCVAL